MYPDERNAFYREYDDQAYTVEPFFLSYLTLEIPFEFVMGTICTLFLVIPGFPSTLPLEPRSDSHIDTVGSFFLVLFEVFCFVNCGESLGIMFCTLFNHSGLSVNFTSIVNSLFTCMAGYFVFADVLIIVLSLPRCPVFYEDSITSQY